MLVVLCSVLPLCPLLFFYCISKCTSLKNRQLTRLNCILSAQRLVIVAYSDTYGSRTTGRGMQRRLTIHLLTCASSFLLLVMLSLLLEIEDQKILPACTLSSRNSLNMGFAGCNVPGCSKSVPLAFLIHQLVVSWKKQHQRATKVGSLYQHQQPHTR